jgi:predicted dehydrogenase
MAGSSNTPLRVAVIGTGFGARVQVPALLGLADVIVVALCGASDQKTKDTAAQFGVKAVYTDYEQMLVDVEPDIAVISAPPKWHNSMTVAALQAGAHALCEKPMALAADEAQEMVDTAREFKRVGVIDFELRYLPARYYQRVLVDQGFIGEPVLLETSLLSRSRWGPDHVWNWWMDADQGGGILGAAGSHAIDAFRWLTGREVCAVTASLHTTPQYKERPLPNESGARAVTSDDGATLILDMDGGLRGVITLSAVAGGETQRLAIHGTEGALVVQDERNLWGRERGQPLDVIAVPPEYEPPMWVPDENLNLGPFAKLVGLMVDQIRGEAIALPPSFEDGLAVQRVMDAARVSSREGRRVEIAT